MTWNTRMLKPILEHVLAGIQYVLGDRPATTGRA